MTTTIGLGRPEKRSSRLIAGCGYVGHRTALHWRDRGREVHAVTRSPQKAAELADAGLLPVQLDLSQPGTSAELPVADVVLWAVGFDRTAGVDREQIWLKGLSWLIDNLSSAPRRFIYVSSTSVYGYGDGETVDEAAPVNPVSEGGQCCLQAEQLVRARCGERFPDTKVIILRFAGIYGPDRLLRRIDQLREGTPLPGNPDHPLNLIHVDDAVRVIDAVSGYGDAPELLNVVNSGTLTRREYYESLAELVGAPGPVFDSTAAQRVTSKRPLVRGGNRQVVSAFRSWTAECMQFNDVRAGIADAVTRSEPS